MPNQAIIKNIIEGNAIAVKQSIYESLSEKAFDLLEIKKVEIGSDIFDQQNESADELEEGTVHPADAHRILNQTGGVDTDHFAIGMDNITKRMELAKRHGYVARGDSPTGRSKAYRTSLHLQRQAAKYKPNNESVENLDEEQLNELSKKTLGNYIKKASYDVGMSGFKQGKAVGNAGAYHKKPDKATAKEMADRSEKRERGIERAVNKLTKEEYADTLDEDQLNELSKKTLGNYVKKAASTASVNSYNAGMAMGGAGVELSRAITRERRRQKGINVAVKKLTKEDFEFINEAISPEARELVIHADNDSHLYHSSHVPIAKNLEKKFKRGEYDHEKAKKLWKYHADRAADSYAKEHGSSGQKGHHIFSPSHRREAASEFADAHKAEMEAGNFHS